MQKKFAFDVVILPPREITQRIIALTAHLPPDATRLNPTTCLPHLSLLQGALAADRLPEAETLLKAIAARHPFFRITLPHVGSYRVPDQGVFSQLVADQTDQLTRLHHDVMGSFRSLMETGKVTIDMFVSPPEVAEISTYWTRTYYEKRDKEGFDPHITLGAGQIDELATPIDFMATRLVLCQLGTFCTCRKILAEATLAS